MDPRAIVGRIVEHPRVAFVVAVMDAYGSAAGGLLANGLAYAALFAALPTTLLLLGIAGFVARDPAYQGELIAQLSAALPPLSDLLDDALVAVSEGAGVSSILGFIGLVWAVSQFYATLDLAFARIFSDSPERDLARRALRGFAWVAILVGTVVAAIVVTSLAALLETTLPSRIPLARTVTEAASSPMAILVLTMVVVAVAYRVLPPRAPGWRAVIVPAIVVGVAVTLLAQAFGLLAPILVRGAALAGSLAAAFIALAWLSFTFQAVLLGAAWVRVADRGRSGPSTDPTRDRPPAPS